MLATNLKVSGVPVFSDRRLRGRGRRGRSLLEDRERRPIASWCVRDGRLCGAVLFGDTADALWYRELIRQQASIAPIRDALAFGKAYAEAA